MHKASTELITILKNNGLRNKSYLYTKDYGERYSCKEPYDPCAYKRAFGLGTGKRRLKIYFNYNYISVTERGRYLTDEYYELDESQLRSIIAYFKCSYQRQKTLKGTCNYKIEFAGQLMKKERERGWVEPPFDAEFEKFYNSVKI